VHYSALSLCGGGSCYFHLQGRKTETVLVFCREVYFYSETGRRRFLLHVGNFLLDYTGQITENVNSHSHNQEELKPHKQMKFLCLVFVTSCHYCSFLLLVNQLNRNLCFDSTYLYLIIIIIIYCTIKSYTDIEQVNTFHPCKWFFCFVSLVLFYTVNLFSSILFLISQFAAFLVSYPYLTPSHYPVHSTLKMLSVSLSFNTCTLPATGLATAQP